MDIDELLRDLGPVDATELRDNILSLEQDAWDEAQIRQKVFDVHRETESIVMIFVDLERWPELVIRKEPGWNRIAETAVPLMHKVIDAFYPKGGTIIRAMAAKLKVNGRIKPHIDTHPSFHVGHRIHIPITTNSRVRFYLDGKPHQLQIGRAYEVNNQTMHSVMNKGSDDRITFIFDYIPPAELGRMAAS